MPEETVSLRLVLENQEFSKRTKDASRAMKRFGDTSVRQSRRIAGAFTLITKPLTSLTRSLISFRGIFLTIGAIRFFKIFIDLERSLTNVLTLVDDANVTFETFEARLKAISNITGLGFRDLSSALFDIVSAGIEAADALEVLSVASKLAVAGNTDVASAAKALVAIMKTYNVEFDKAIEVSDALFAAQKVGITTVKALANNTGKVAPTARLAGLSIRELTSSISALTVAGLSTDEAGTALRAILTTLLRPSEQSKDAARLLGIELSTAAIRGGTFAEFLAELFEKTQGNAEVLALLFNNVRAFGGIANLTADNVQNLTKALTASEEAAGATLTAFEKVEKTLDINISRVISQFNSLASEIIKAFKPGLVSTTEAIVSFLVNLRRLFQENRIEIVATIEATFDRIVQIIQFTARAIENRLLPDLLFSDAAALISGFGALIDTLAIIVGEGGRRVARFFNKGFLEGIEGGVFSVLSHIASVFGVEALRFVGLNDKVIKALDTQQKLIGAFESADKIVANFEEQANLNNYLRELSQVERVVARLILVVNKFSAGESVEEAQQLRKAGDIFADAAEKFNTAQARLANFEFAPKAFEGISKEELQKQANETRANLNFAFQSLKSALGGASELVTSDLKNLLPSGVLVEDILGEDNPESFISVLKRETKKLPSKIRSAMTDAFDASATDALKEQAKAVFRNTYDQRLFEAALSSLPENFQNALNLILTAGSLGAFNPEQVTKVQARLAESFAKTLNVALFDQALQKELDAVNNKSNTGAVDRKGAPQVPVNEITADLTDLTAGFKDLVSSFLEERQRLQEALDAGLISRDEAIRRDAELIADMNSAISDSIGVLQSKQSELGEEFANLALPAINGFLDQLDRLRTTVVNDDLFSGFMAGIRRASDAFKTFGEVGIQIGQTLTTEFASGVARSFTEANASFAQFASDFLRRIAQMIIQAAILRSINSLLGFTPGAVDTSGASVFGFNRGTPSVPGPNVNKDVVNARLTPGEAIIRRESAQGYGEKIMQAINLGLIPKEVLELFVKGRGIRSVGSLFNFNQGTSSVPSGSGSSGFGDRSVILADEQDFDKLRASGGDKSLLRWAEQNGDILRALQGNG